jgi:hypothetical protein
MMQLLPKAKGLTCPRSGPIQRQKPLIPLLLSHRSLDRGRRGFPVAPTFG